MEDTMIMKHNVSIKSESYSDRTIRFIGSDESVDRDGDTISIDGWELGNYIKNPVVLYAHDRFGMPVGKADVTVDRLARQLIFDVKFPSIAELSSDPTNPSEHALMVDAIYNMAKSGILNTVSVGFRGIEYEPTATGRSYTKQELMEVSIVPIPANPNAVAVLRAAGCSDIVIKGVTTMQTKGNRRFSKETASYMAERLEAVERACGELRKYMADEAEEGEPDDKAGEPNVGEETGTDVNDQQPDPAKNYVLELVEKASTDSKK